jgi:hypothetical protein
VQRDTALPCVDPRFRVSCGGNPQGPRASRKLGLKCLIALKPAPNCACTAGQEIAAGLLSWWQRQASQT